MDVTSVSLSEVLAASSLRAASLVPETSGYLALAIADASARLPFRLEDSLVSLTTEGTVKVARGSEIVPPDESARRVRDVLARLLAHSIGSAPALAMTSRVRNEANEGVDGFIRELEAALVPVNRAAARRALARLARETVRAKDSGKLRRRKVRKPEDVAPEAPAPATAPAPAPAPVQVAAPPAPVAPPAPQRKPSVPPVAHAEPEIESIDIEISAAPQAAVVEASAVEAHDPREDAEETPFDPGPPAIPEEEAATTIDTEVAHEEPVDVATAFQGVGRRSDLDELLNRFEVSQLSSAESMSSARASLKRLAGLDPTPPPPSVEELKKLTQKPPAVSTPVRIELRAERKGRSAEPARKSSGRWAVVALVALGLVIAGLLGHYVPQWLGGQSAASLF